MASEDRGSDSRLLNAERVEVDEFPAESPVVKLYDYWRAAAPAPDVLPGWQHIDPDEMDAEVRHWICIVDVIETGGAPLDYLYRLIGPGNVLLVGRDATGQLASTVFGRVDAPFLLGTFDLTAETGTPTFWIATVPQDQVGEVTIHRGLLPMARDGRNVDMLLCAAAPWPVA